MRAKKKTKQGKLFIFHLFQVGQTAATLIPNKVTFNEERKNKAANADHYPRAAGPILGYHSTRTTTSPHVDSAALRGSREKITRNFAKVAAHFLSKSCIALYALLQYDEDKLLDM